MVRLKPDTSAHLGGWATNARDVRARHPLARRHHRGPGGWRTQRRHRVAIHRHLAAPRARTGIGVSAPAQEASSIEATGRTKRLPVLTTPDPCPPRPAAGGDRGQRGLSNTEKLASLETQAPAWMGQASTCSSRRQRPSRSVAGVRAWRSGTRSSRGTRESVRTACRSRPECGSRVPGRRSATA